MKCHNLSAACSPFARSWLLGAVQNRSTGSTLLMKIKESPRLHRFFIIEKSSQSGEFIFLIPPLYKLCTRTNCALVARSLAAILPTGGLMIRGAAEVFYETSAHSDGAAAAERVPQPLGRGAVRPLCCPGWDPACERSPLATR